MNFKTERDRRNREKKNENSTQKKSACTKLREIQFFSLVYIWSEFHIEFNDFCWTIPLFIAYENNKTKEKHCFWWKIRKEPPHLKFKTRFIKYQKEKAIVRFIFTKSAPQLTEKYEIHNSRVCSINCNIWFICQPHTLFIVFSYVRVVYGRYILYVIPTEC